jgi:hypothetical protein
VSFIDRYEEQLQQLARHWRCDGIICGHIHTPEDKRVGEIHYLNSGDWVESLSAIVEHHDGRFELLHYDGFLERLAPQLATNAVRECAEPSAVSAPGAARPERELAGVG